MKTYILSCLDRIQQYSKHLDAKAILYNKSWEVFNDSGDKEQLIFKPNNELLIARKGIVQKTKWELLSINSILIETDSITYLFNAAFVDNDFLALQLDGTNECMVMIESGTKNEFVLDSISNIDAYLNNTYVPHLSTDVDSVDNSSSNSENERRKLSKEDKIALSIVFAVCGGFMLMWIIAAFLEK